MRIRIGRFCNILAGQKTCSSLGVCTTETANLAGEEIFGLDLFLFRESSNTDQNTSISPHKCDILMLTVQHRIMNYVNFDKRLSKYFAELGRKSRKSRMKKLSAKQRREIAQNAANARWAKQKRKKK